MKYFSIALVGFALMACTPEEGTDVTSAVTPLCIDGVQYWTMYMGSQAGLMSPRVDSETLTFVRCTEKEK